MMGKEYRYSRKNRKAIQAIVEEKAGISIYANRMVSGYRNRWIAVMTGSLMCFALLCAFAYAKFSSLNGDEACFASVYLGDGRFEIVIVNDSDRELKLQDEVKVMQWSTGEEVEGENGKIRMSGDVIAPYSQGIVYIDLSEGYDVEAMQQNLSEGDDYYFVLTNNDFAFGQDWMCFFDFEIRRTEEVAEQLVDSMEQRRKMEDTQEQKYTTAELMNPEWSWPTVSRNVSGYFGRQKNGGYSDHANIAGICGDDIFAVADGVVVETGFNSVSGNYILVDLGEDVTIKYGYLEEIKVFGSEKISQGQVIGSLGKTGMATGPNLLFAVSVGGEAVNPFVE